MVYFIVSIVSPITMVGNKYDMSKSKPNFNEYIKMFWVGLMDGDGSIQVNHWRKKTLQYRLIIKLSNLESNYSMLILVAKSIGGTVRVVNSKKEVIWVVDSKKTICQIIAIFDTYPPITSRLICQLNFLKACLKDISVNSYLINRNGKYHNQQNIINTRKVIYVIPDYFHSWLSGFIEAEGCFSIRVNKNNSFSIGQNDDYYIIKAIKFYFDLSVMVRNPNKSFYVLETSKKKTLSRIIEHCSKYPLLGEKAQSLNKFIKVCASHKN